MSTKSVYFSLIKVAKSIVKYNQISPDGMTSRFILPHLNRRFLDQHHPLIGKQYKYGRRIDSKFMPVFRIQIVKVYRSVLQIINLLPQKTEVAGLLDRKSVYRFSKVGKNIDPRLPVNQKKLVLVFAQERKIVFGTWK